MPADPRDESTASGDFEPRPKGPKPILGWNAASGSDGEAGTDDDGPGAAASTDAWKWQGVPPGRNYLYPVEPGKPRHYLAFDRPGSKLVELPPAWPTDDVKEDG
jgi:hypothetical protein